MTWRIVTKSTTKRNFIGEVRVNMCLKAQTRQEVSPATHAWYCRNPTQVDGGYNKLSSQDNSRNKPLHISH